MNTPSVVYRVGIIERYVFREILQPFFTALLFWTSLFVSMVLKDVIGDLFGKGIEWYKILLYLVYLIGEKVTQTVPMACLFAGILAAGRLSGDSEITAMRASGVSFPRIYSVFLFFGFLSMLVVGMINLYWGPISAREREDFEEWLKTYHSLTLAKPGKFLGSGSMDGVSDSGQDIYVREREGQQLRGVHIRIWNNEVKPIPGQPQETIRVKNVNIPIGDGVITQIIQAEKGRILRRVNEDGTEETLLRLEDGYVIDTKKDQSKLTVTDFRDGFMDYVIPPPKKPLGRLNVRPDNYTFPELFSFLKRLRSGEHKIDLDAIAGGNVKIGEGQGTNVYELPTFEEMELLIQQNKIWLVQNAPLAGKPGGPTQLEVQKRIQVTLQYDIFLKDAEKTERRFEVEIHKRLATPVACMLFFFVAFPLGLVVKRSGKGMSFALALFVFFVYYLVLSLGLSRAYSGGIPSWAGAWLPDIVIFGFGMYIMASRTEGFTPLKFLSAPFRYLRKKLITPVADRISRTSFYRSLEDKFQPLFSKTKGIIVRFWLPLWRKIRRKPSGS